MKILLRFKKNINKTLDDDTLISQENGAAPFLIKISWKTSA
jgi:hypothetical protein